MEAAARFALVVTPLAAALLLASCDGGYTQPSAGEPDPPPAETVRGCRTAAYGEIAPEARKDAVTAGPLTLLVANRARRAPVEPVVKVLALVRVGETATVVVPRAERSRLSLLYDFSRPGPRRPLRLSDGSSAVRFSACTRSEEWAEGRPYPDPRETQFNGGLFVRGAQCASLDVWIEDRAEPLRLSLGLGGRDRRCPPGRAS